MRVARFASKLDFEVDKDTAKASQKLAHNITGLSPERIKDELIKMAKLRTFFNQYSIFIGDPTTETIQGFLNNSKDLLTEAKDFEENRHSRLTNLDRTKVDKSIQIETDHRLKVLKNHYHIDDLLKQSNDQALEVSRAQKDLEESLPVPTPEKEPVDPSNGHEPQRTRLTDEEILSALARARYHRGKAAEILGVSRTTLWRRLRSINAPGPET